MKKQVHRLSISTSLLFRQLLLAILALSCLPGLFAQATITVGNGGTTNVNVPVRTYYGYTYSQTLVYGSEMGSFLGFPGDITKIRFYYGSGPSNNSNNWTIYLGNSVKTEFTSNTDWVPLGQLTQVFSGIVSYPGSSGWMEIVLDNSFAYTGGNLVIAVDENTPSYSSNPGVSWRSTATGVTNRSIYYYDDSNNPNPNSPPTATGRYTGHPDLQFEIIPVTACGGVPVPGNTISSINAACMGTSGNVLLTVQNSYAQYSGITYQWQEFDGLNWNNISGATLADLSMALPSVTTQYRNNITCAGGGTATSTPVTVTIHPLPTITVTPSSFALCSGDTAALSAGGALNYNWSPATGLSSTSGQFVQAFPTAYTIYTVAGTDVNGCVGIASAMVSPIIDLQIETAFSPAQVCAPGTPVTMNVTQIPVGLSNSGVWEFQWTDTSGNIILQSWSPNAQYIETPAVAGLYMYEVNMRSTACPSELPTSNGLVSFYAGFGANVTTQHINCNIPTGSFTLSDIFGQPAADTIYANDFSSNILNPIQEEVFGVASVNGGRCVLTPSAGSQKGAFAVYNPNQIGGIDASYEISFNLTADLPINNFGTGGADGIAYCFGDDAIYTGNGDPANGYGSKLRISFDAANNQTSNGNIIGIYLTYGYTPNTPMGPNTPEVLAYSSDMSWKLATDVPVRIIIDHLGRLSLTVGGSMIFQHVQLPSAFVAADKTNWIHLFSAHTGGDAMRQAIDNLIIQYHQLNIGLAPGGSGTMPTSWQTSNVFPGLVTGSYDIWISNPLDTNCSAMIGTFDILDINPAVNLGNDTSICPGASLLLDAGNPGNVYQWSDNSTGQTLTVNSIGTYWVIVTDTAGCFDIDAISVTSVPVPSVNGILVSASTFTYIFTADLPQNVTNYAWDFGDGNNQSGSSPSVMHTYASSGTYTAQLIVTNHFQCTADTIQRTVIVPDYLGTTPEEMPVISIYPNPATDYVTVHPVAGMEISRIQVYDVSGKLLTSFVGSNATFNIPVSAWAEGLYLLYIHAGTQTVIEKLIIKK